MKLRNKRIIWLIKTSTYLLLSINFLWIDVLCAELQERKQIPAEVRVKIREEANEFIKRGEIEKAINIYDEAIKNYKPDWYLVGFTWGEKVKIYIDAKKYDLAEKTILSLRNMDIDDTLINQNISLSLIIEASIYSNLVDLYLAMKDYENAVKSKESWRITQEKILESSTFESDRQKIGILLRISPGYLSSIYYEWGKYDLARKGYQDLIDYLNSDSTKQQLLIKLPEENRIMWEEINPRVVYPLKIAKCYEEEGNYTNALKYAELVKQAIENTSLKQRYEKFSSKVDRIKNIQEKELNPLIERCKQKQKELEKAK